MTEQPRRETAPNEDGRRIPATRLEALVRAVCRGGGSHRREAERVAHYLVAANLCGHDSHGIGILPTYVDSLIEGLLKPNRHVAVLAANEGRPVDKIFEHTGGRNFPLRASVLAESGQLAFFGATVP